MIASLSLCRLWVYDPHRTVHRICIFAVLIAAVCLGGCIAVVPYPMSKRIQALAPGDETYDLSFITAAVTQRSEIERKLSDLDSGVNTPGTLWLRYQQSTSGIVGGAALPYGGGTATAHRNWTDYNLFLTFNDNGTLQTFETVPDSKLDAFLATWIAAHPRPLTLPVQIPVAHHHRDYGTASGELILSADEIRYREITCNPGANPGGLIGRATYHRETCGHEFAYSSTVPVVVKRNSPSHDDRPIDDTVLRTLTIGSAKDKAEFTPAPNLSPDKLLDLVAYLQHYRTNVRYR